jgi:ATP-dependent Lon protease
MLTAYRAGIKTVVIPKRNKKDLVEIPRRVKRGVNVILAERMDEVLAEALLPPPSPPHRRRS